MKKLGVGVYYIYMQKRRISLPSIILGGFLFAPLFVFAQTATTTSALQKQIDQLISARTSQLPKIEDLHAKAILDYLNVGVTPKNPGPMEKVRVTIESYLSDMNKATISWALDGKIIEHGVGKTAFSFQNGPSGKTTHLTISIITNTGDRVTKELSWSPIGLTILWEADTYTPPFYRGKALLSPQAKVRTVAIPDNTGEQNALGAGNLVYVWEKDGTIVPEASGYGKNFFSFVAPKPFEKATVKVRASSLDDTLSSETRINLPLSEPVILFYEKHPLLGVWYNRPFDTDVTLNKKEFSVSAEPYFFSNEQSDTPALEYDWAVNGTPTQNYGHTITLRNDAGTKGDSAISLTMHGLKQTFQSASQTLRVHFAGEEATSRPTF